MANVWIINQPVNLKHEYCRILYYYLCVLFWFWKLVLSINTVYICRMSRLYLLYIPCLLYSFDHRLTFSLILALQLSRYCFFQLYL